MNRSDKHTPDIVAQNIKSIIKEKFKDLSEYAQHKNISATQLYNILNGKEYMSLFSAARFAADFDLNIDYCTRGELPMLSPEHNYKVLREAAMDFYNAVLDEDKLIEEYAANRNTLSDKEDIYFRDALKTARFAKAKSGCRMIDLINNNSVDNSVNNSVEDNHEYDATMSGIQNKHDAPTQEMKDENDTPMSEIRSMDEATTPKNRHEYETPMSEIRHKYDATTPEIINNYSKNNEMTLHEAIEKVLREAGRPLTFTEIAKAVNKDGLYSRKDRKPVPASQISARVKNYPSLFDVNRKKSPAFVSLSNGNNH